MSLREKAPHPSARLWTVERAILPEARAAHVPKAVSAASTP